MKTIKLYGKNQIDLAREFAGIVGGEATVEGDLLRFDVSEVIELRDVAEGADRYWRGLRKLAKSKAAAELREKFATIEIIERQFECR